MAPVPALWAGTHVLPELAEPRRQGLSAGQGGTRSCSAPGPTHGSSLGGRTYDQAATTYPTP